MGKKSERTTLKSLDSRIRDLESRPARAQTIALWISGLSALAALASAVTAILAFCAQREAYDTSIQPEVECRAIPSYDFSSARFQIVNHGIRPVVDLRTAMYVLSVDSSGHRILSKISASTWHMFHTLGVGETTGVQISTEELKRSMKAAFLAWEYAIPKTSVVHPVFVFRTSFRRRPDNRLFSERTLLYVEENGATGEPIAIAEGSPRAWEYSRFNPLIDSMLSTTRDGVRF